MEIVSAHADVQGRHHLAPANRVHPDVRLEETRARDYDPVLLPGGVVNADQRFVRALMEEGKPVAVICHGGWLLISAGLVEGRTLTSRASLGG